jgi:hypothetical protein
MYFKYIFNFFIFFHILNKIVIKVNIKSQTLNYLQRECFELALADQELFARSQVDQ